MIDRPSSTSTTTNKSRGDDDVAFGWIMTERLERMIRSNGIILETSLTGYGRASYIPLFVGDWEERSVSQLVLRCQRLEEPIVEETWTLPTKTQAKKKLREQKERPTVIFPKSHSRQSRQRVLRGGR